jgi:hypothetical protein
MLMDNELAEALRSPERFSKKLEPALRRHLLPWQVEVIKVMVEREVMFSPPVSPLPGGMLAQHLWTQAKAHKMILGLLPSEAFSP